MAKPNPFAKKGAKEDTTKSGYDPPEPDADDRKSAKKANPFGGKKANPFGAGAASGRGGGTSSRNIPRRAASSGQVPASKRAKY